MFLSNELRDQYRSAVQEHINEFSIYRTTGEERLPGKKPGSRYKWQFYMSRTTCNKWMNYFISCLLLDLIYEEYQKQPFQLGALESDGVPIALGMAQASINIPGIENLNFFKIRKQPKEYGLMNTIEGIPSLDLPVLFVDDIVSSKNTSYNAYKALKYEGFEIVPFVTSVINKTGTEMKTEVDMMTKEDIFKRNGIDMDVKSIFNLNDFEFMDKEFDHFGRQGE